MNIQRMEHSRTIGILRMAEEQGLCAWSCCPAEHQLLRRSVQRGQALMPAPDLYISRATWDRCSYAQRIAYILRSVSVRHPQLTLCGPSAAAIHGFTDSFRLQQYVHVIARGGTRTQTRQGFVFHYAPTAETTVIHGIRVTSALQTMFDCARALDFTNAMIICCAGLRQLDEGSGDGREKEGGRGGKEKKEDVSRFFAQHRGFVGISRAKYVIERANALCENGGEAAALAAVMMLGFQVPRMQVEFNSPMRPGRLIRTDFLWIREDGSMVAGELDGRRKYVERAMTRGGDAIDVVLAEKDRETELNMLGIAVVRFSIADVRNRASLLAKLERMHIPRTPPAPSPFDHFHSKAY